MIPSVISAKSIKEATFKTVKHVNDKGKPKKDERGERVIESKHVIIRIPWICCEDSDDLLTFICGFAFGKNLITGKPACLGECVNSRMQDPEYSYGQELHENNGLDETIKKLKENPESRRVVNPLFKPAHYGKTDIPCMIITVWDIEEDNLNLTILGRSNEVAIAMKSDIRGFAYLLEYVAYQAGYIPGVILFHDVNAHIRMSDKNEIDRILEERY